MAKKTCNIVGSSFHAGASNWIAKLHVGQKLRLEREPTNRFDPNAVAVYIFQQCLGYLSRGVAGEIAPIMDAGTTITASKSPLHPGTGVIDLEW